MDSFLGGCGGGGGVERPAATSAPSVAAHKPTNFATLAHDFSSDIFFPPNRENVVSTPVLSFFFEGATRPSSDRYKGQIRQIRHIGILCPSAVVLKERKRTLPELCYTDTRCQTFVNSISS